MNNLSKLPERLKELMSDHDFTPVKLGEKIGVNRNTITRYLKGDILPSFENFVKLIEVFNCSADFFIGLVDFPPTDVTYAPVPPFNKQFRALMKKHSLSQYKLHDLTGFSYDNFNKWLKGITSPYIDNLMRLAEAFDCSVDYLLGRIE